MMINNQYYIKLFSNILPVKGAKQSILCDSQRGEYRVIPNDLFDILMEYDGSKLGDIVKAYGETNKSTILEYMHALYEEECIFLCDTQEEVDCFPKLDMTFESSSIITNAILDIDSDSNHNYQNLIDQLNALGCENLEIRIFENVGESVYQDIFRSLIDSLIEYCVLIMPFDAEKDLQDYKQMLKENKRLAKIVIHSSDRNSSQNNMEREENCEIFYTKQVINSAACCGNVSAKYFNPDLRFITESINYNSCLNQKISIDRKGNIKNCPAMKRSYGRLDDSGLLNIVNLDAFQEVWKINKDQIETCRDCEFRYICQDCRALVEDPLNKYSKPLKCNYNPYVAAWEN